ncbi:MAG: glycyl-radical enzyme activating protein [Desulfuromonadales bacterium]|nr:glycyl-radical enzyme activating protein [Desulfuromonadales bacterium]
MSVRKTSRSDMPQPLVFDIKRYSINDGPGIRATIFFKGCPLNCQWCHNPESISPKVQKLFTAAKCIGCGECCRACPVDACRLVPDGVVTDGDLCTLCGQCAEVCPTLATQMSGRYYSVAELLDIVVKERPFFDQSGGGVTFSGGEPLLYPEFLIEILEACGRQGVHRAVDTSGFVKKEVLLKVAQQTDLFLYDLKMVDAEKHKRYTGVDNRLILNNLVALAECGSEVQIRIPLVGGVNDDDDSVAAMAAYVAALPGEKRAVSLLPFHDIARGKDEKLGQGRDLAALHEPGADAVQRVIEAFAGYGLTVTIGG